MRTVGKLDNRELMDWNNIYIVGNPGFKKDVARKLEHSDLKYMPGYLGNVAGATDYDMYWVDKTISLRSLKEAIGAKYIWKHRIKFYDSLEKFLASQNSDNVSTSITDQDRELINEMRNSPNKKYLAA
ncbi:MAG TPA: hypothetical protein VIS49_04385 [Cyclobacteriaceae bacterium]